MDVDMISLPFKLVPDQLYWIAIGVLAVGVGVQTFRIASLKTDVAVAETNVQVAKTALADEIAARATAALEHGKFVAKVEHEHAKDQQELEAKYAAKLKELADSRVADNRVADGLRRQLSNFAAGGRRAGETDAAALERYQHRLDTIGSLLGESIDLLIEGRGVAEGQANQIVRLIDQLHLDRKACEAWPVPPAKP